MNDIQVLLRDPGAWAALATLIVMEIVLGIDNLIFVAILTNKLPDQFQVTARRVGIGLALVLRLALLGAVAFIVHLTDPVIAVGGLSFSWRDMILIAGGLFLVWKATSEIRQHVEPDEEELEDTPARPAGLGSAIAQIIVLDLVFSIDSIITAVGMTDHVPIMFAAVIVAVGAMMLAATPLANFIKRNPTIVMLALGFLLMIGMSLIAEGFGAHVPKGYIYTAMAFSAGVELLNLVARRQRRRRKARAAEAAEPVSDIRTSDVERAVVGGARQPR